MFFDVASSKLNAIILHARSHPRYKTQVKENVEKELLGHFTAQTMPPKALVEWFAANFDTLCMTKDDWQELIAAKWKTWYFCFVFLFHVF